ncbi:putative RNA-directed DNA polymerase, eukaryota, reverse transcriptase zinc-binding domain protein [Tanacetum coccineum]
MGARYCTKWPTVKTTVDLSLNVYISNEVKKHATRWVKLVPSKINVLAWKVSLDRLPTRLNLISRGVTVSSSSCPVCDSAPEDLSHLLFSCSMASDVYRLVCRWWNIGCPSIGSYSDWLSWFFSIRLGSKVKLLLCLFALPASLLFCRYVPLSMPACLVFGFSACLLLSFAPVFRFFSRVVCFDALYLAGGLDNVVVVILGCNSYFITLVPKVEDPIVIDDFRPISLIGCQYKIIAKVLANRLSKVIASVVSEVQMAFVKGRQIIDGPLIVDEIIAWAKKRKKRFLINGSPTKEFKLDRGLRQGDPLSPFLFIIAVEALNVALLESTNNNIFHGIKVGKNKVHISHLQFADDALIMGEWSLSNAKNLSRILTCFHLASGLRVNFNKSKLFGIGVTNLELNTIASSIGLSNWKAKTLSFGGRLTLIRSVLGSLGVYYFSTFKAPKKIICKLEGIRRCFFWGGSANEKKISWIAWDKVTSPRNMGGLGIGSLKASNQSLLAKWWWRIRNEEHALWSKVICSLYGLWEA